MNPFLNLDEIDYFILTSGGKRIFARSLNRYKAGSNGAYAVYAGKYKILFYYDLEPEFEVCINENPNNCVSAVRIN